MRFGEDDVIVNPIWCMVHRIQNSVSRELLLFRYRIGMRKLETIFLILVYKLKFLVSGLSIEAFSKAMKKQNFNYYLHMQSLIFESHMKGMLHPYEFH
jgi:hypothetical protein